MMKDCIAELKQQHTCLEESEELLCATILGVKFLKTGLLQGCFAGKIIIPSIEPSVTHSRGAAIL